MLLTVSVGNTNVAFGIFDGMKLIRHDRLPNDQLPLLAKGIGDERFDQIALASVSPSRTDQVISLLARRYNALVRVAGRDLPYGIEIQCDDPEKVGADRILNAVAAFARTRRATIVVDVGSATTVDFVSRPGAFCGGAIAPGPEMMLCALHEHTELLPSISPDAPPAPLGRCRCLR